MSNHKEWIGEVVVDESTGYDGKLYHLDDGGIYFESNERIEPGDKIAITIKRLNNSEVTLEVEVLWRKELNNATFDCGYGVRALNPRATLRQV